MPLLLICHACFGFFFFFFVVFFFVVVDTLLLVPSFQFIYPYTDFLFFEAPADWLYLSYFLACILLFCLLFLLFV